VLPAAVSNGDVIIIVVLVAIPIAAIAFAGAGAVYREIGKGAFAMDHDKPRGSTLTDSQADRAVQQVEIRQMLEAKAFRQRERGEEPLDIDAEMRRINAPAPARDLSADPALIAEVRQLVVARNARRARQGKEPLDVDAEVARQLEDLQG
jgi:hypothetical protein